MLFALTHSIRPAEYQKLLATNPDDTDALVKSGMLLFNIGAMNNDNRNHQEAANYLQQFVDKAHNGQI